MTSSGDTTACNSANNPIQTVGIYLPLHTAGAATSTSGDDILAPPTCDRYAAAIHLRAPAATGLLGGDGR